MKLLKLIKELNKFYKKKIVIKTDLNITKICYDSRKVILGSLFVAIEGKKLDGHNFIDEAVSKGAIIVITQKEIKSKVHNVQYIKVEDTRKCLAEIACIVNNNPSDFVTMIGITGTNGKTTTSYVIDKIIKNAGYNSGIIGTVTTSSLSFENNYPSTTPESLELQCIIRKMINQLKTYVVLEVSSHALDLQRVHGCNFDIAVFTNFTQDHLDYHINLENYWVAKQKLFNKYLKKNGIAIVNIHDNKGKFLVKNIRKDVKVITTGYTDNCDIWANILEVSSKRTRGKIITPIGNFNFNSSLIGKFNLNNILNAVGTGVALGFKLIDISNGVNENTVVPGRLNLIANSKNIFVYIDYAHTPDALEQVIKTLKYLHNSRIIIIFGCGGNRDTTKRATMGEIAGKLSELSIITADNPRLEKLETIIEQITEGIKKTKSVYIKASRLLKNKFLDGSKRYTIIFDRQEAISIGLKIAKPGDTVLIVGKGHEKYQIIGNRKFKFNEIEEIKKQIK